MPEVSWEPAGILRCTASRIQSPAETARREPKARQAENNLHLDFEVGVVYLAGGMEPIDEREVLVDAIL